MVQNDSAATKQSNDHVDGSKKISKKQGHWNQIEHTAYLHFLKQNANHTKGQRLFKRMSYVVGTRTPSQCRYAPNYIRSHHQKFNPLKIKSTPETGFMRSKQYARKYCALHKSADEENI